MSYSPIEIKKLLEETRALLFWTSSSSPVPREEVRASSGYLSTVIQSFNDFAIAELVQEHPNIPESLFWAASLIETGTANCGGLAKYFFLRVLHLTPKPASCVFKRNNDLLTHGCVLLSPTRDQKTGKLKKPFMGKHAQLADPFYNSIHTFDEVFNNATINARYFENTVEVLSSKRDEEMSPEDLKKLGEAQRLFVEKFSDYLKSHPLPDATNTLKINNTEYFCVVKGKKPLTTNYLVDREKAHAALANQLLLAVKNNDEIRMIRIRRLFRFLEPNNSLLIDSLPHTLIFLCREKNGIFNNDRKQCYELLMRAFELAKNLKEDKTRNFIQGNVLALLPILLKKLPDEYKDKLSAEIKQALERREREKDNKKDQDKPKGSEDSNSTLETAAAESLKPKTLDFPKTLNSSLVFSKLSSSANSSTLTSAENEAAEISTPVKPETNKVSGLI